MFRLAFCIPIIVMDKSNEELYSLYHSGGYADETLSQLIRNLTPMMIFIGQKHLRKISIYDESDYIQEGSFVLWRLLEKDVFNGECKISTLFYKAFERHCIRLYRDYVLKNMVIIGESPDYHSYGYHICAMVEDDYAKRYREKHREECKRWYDANRRKVSADDGKTKLTEEERRERRRQRSKAYYEAHKEQYREAKRKWYEENRDYALLYQKAYDQGVRIGRKGPCKGKRKKR